MRFLLGEYAKVPCTVKEDDSDSEDLGRTKQKIEAKFKNSRKTRARTRKKDKLFADAKAKKLREPALNVIFPPVYQLWDPQGFVERLLAVLRNTTERFPMRLLMMQVISKLIAAHQLILLGFYPYLERYMQPFIQKCTVVMTVAAQAVHDLVPPDAISPLMRTIAHNFITDKVQPDVITVGINTIRELCRRQPLIMTEELLQEIVEFKSFKRDKGVIMAARGVLALFRELAPQMLKKKDRGKFHNPEAVIPGYASQAPATEIEGIELLREFKASGERVDSILDPHKHKQWSKDHKGKKIKRRRTIYRDDETRTHTTGFEDDDEWAIASSSASSEGEWIDVSSGNELDDFDMPLSDEEDKKKQQSNQERRQERKQAVKDYRIQQAKRMEEEAMSASEEMDDDDDDGEEAENDDEGGEEDELMDNDEEEDCMADGEEELEEPEDPTEQNGAVGESTNEEDKDKEPETPLEQTHILSPLDWKLLQALRERRDKRMAHRALSTRIRLTKLAARDEDPTEELLEHKTEKKRKLDAETRREEALERRKKGKWAEKKSSKGGGSTNSMKAKKKVFQFTKYSHRARKGKKARQSAKVSRQQAISKKNRKFKTKRGW
eukprot:NODE_9_length_3215_cov_481.018459_g8_i0.p1 GENE.NODE_9_length_3215_cov_481.018459_g8_i0~~NODE_9_length_3215_cov_481.018459_g8_i0.p1  ORF type:complete len:608 (+),score=193.33 NODE_9_length_3215_cov_481.018459_g8_i0:721-2544(+)